MAKRRADARQLQQQRRNPPTQQSPEAVSVEMAAGPQTEYEWLDPCTAPADLLAEHLARYEFALQFVEGRCVLDCASGSGYGSVLLASRAAEVIGVDLNEQAVVLAQDKLSQSELPVIQGDVLALPFRSSVFDVVVSLETIEHVWTPAVAVAEMRRVLKPDTGLLVISTPNREIYREVHGRHNPYHHSEMSLVEFHELLSHYFEQVVVLGQRWGEGVLLSSAAMSEVNAGGAGATSDTLALADYFVAVCALGSLPAVRGLLLIPDQGNVLIERTIWAQGLDRELDSARKLVRRLQAKVEERTAWARARDKELSLEQERRQRLQDELDSVAARVQELKGAVDERTRWAQQLDSELRVARQRIAELQASAEERNAWAGRLQSELDAARLHVRGLQSALEERTESARRVEAELIDQLQTRTDWAHRLDEELRTARRLVTDLQERVAERTTWAVDLDTQLVEARARMRELEQVVEDRTAWAQRLDERLTRSAAQAAELRESVAARDRVVELLVAQLALTRADLEAAERDRDQTIGELEMIKARAVLRPAPEL